MNIFHKYRNMHTNLTEHMQSIYVILEQMSGHEYANFSTFSNNMEVIARFYKDVGEFFNDTGFQAYLKQKDLNLFIEILSIGRAVSLMGNLLVNIRRTLEHSQTRADN